MEIIDNLNKLLGDDIKVTLTRDSKLRIAASTFSIYAFESLRKEQFAVVDDQVAYMPLHGFTSADLGYERGNAVSNLVNKIDEAPLASAYLQTFDQIWSSPQQVEDVTELVYEHIASVYAENSPERIYFLIRYNLFSEFLEDISEDVLPDDLTGWRDSGIWKKPESIREPLTDLPQAPTFNEIFDQLQVLNLAVYTPLSYVLHSKMQKYVDMYAVQAGTSTNTFGWSRRSGEQRT